MTAPAILTKRAQRKRAALIARTIRQLRRDIEIMALADLKRVLTAPDQNP